MSKLGALMQRVKIESITMFEPWQIGQDFHTWMALGRPGRFGQWFLGYHHIEGHSKLFYETSSQTAKEYIMKMEK